MPSHELLLPTLVGTPKQIAWADEVRARLIAAWDRHGAAMLAIEDHRGDEYTTVLRAALHAFAPVVLTQRSAKYWIDRWARLAPASELALAGMGRESFLEGWADQFANETLRLLGVFDDKRDTFLHRWTLLTVDTDTQRAKRAEWLPKLQALRRNEDEGGDL